MNRKALLGEWARDHIVDLVAEMITHHPITVESIAKVIEEAGKLSDFGFHADQLILKKRLELEEMT